MYANMQTPWRLTQMEQNTQGCTFWSRLSCLCGALPEKYSNCSGGVKAREFSHAKAQRRQENLRNAAALCAFAALREKSSPFRYFSGNASLWLWFGRSWLVGPSFAVEWGGGQPCRHSVVVGRAQAHY